MTTILGKMRLDQAIRRMLDGDPLNRADDFEEFLEALALVTGRTFDEMEAMDWDGIIAVMAEVNAKFDAESAAKADATA
jgi:hypothetical protein